MRKLLVLAFAGLIGCAFPAVTPAIAQTISGCGTTAISKADVNDAVKLATAADCFGKAKDRAAEAELVRRERVSALTPPPAPAPVRVYWIDCAAEGGTCTVPGSARVRYGADSRFAYKQVTGSIVCSNAVFGDPAEGVLKSCAYQSSTPPKPVTGATLGDVVKPLPTDAITAIPASIPSNFDVKPLLVPAWGTGAIPVSGVPDVVGAFRFVCAPGHLLYDDPAVFPGQPGRSHLHQFFGNTGANAFSTYESLRTTGDSTCNNILNRSAYWIPAMLDGKGNVVRPDYVAIYYKRRPVDDPLCMKIAAKGCADLPRGLRYVFGYDMVTGTTPTGGGHFNCDGPGAVSGHFRTIPEAAKGCPSGARLGAVIGSPECWDGKRLDSPNHRDHMANPAYIGQAYPQCPASHPYLVPAFTLGAWYAVDDARADGWSLSSDAMPMPDGTIHKMTPGSTLHGDWFGAWDDAVMKLWTDNCINKLLNCSGGDLGNGQQLRMDQGYTYKASPRLVPVPARPRL